MEAESKVVQKEAVPGGRVKEDEGDEEEEGGKKGGG